MPTVCEFCDEDRLGPTTPNSKYVNKTTFFNHLKQVGFAGAQYVFKGQIILSH